MTLVFIHLEPENPDHEKNHTAIIHNGAYLCGLRRFTD
ncbi:MAG: hypothetical protein ACI84C_000905 [Flavobacteriales bacterium]|jgi:hypothetical protein